ncbi:Fc.00g068660.m01.CDS01 [Cosmosporella sp. VM-42]
MLQGDVRDDFSDSVVVPLPSLLNRQQILGLLVLSRSSLFSGWSRSRNLIECAETTQRIFLPFHFSISPGKLVRHGFPDTPKGIQGYWCKFPLSIASHLRPEAKYGVEFFSSFTLSQWCSFSHPQLIYPDHDERSITDDRGYSETFFCCRESSRSEISQELNSTRWVRPLDSHWRREHRGFAKQNDRGQGSNPGEPQSNLGKGGQEKLRDYELEYKLEEEPEEETEKNEVEDQELIEDEAYKERQYIHELDAVETREIWYANWGQSHIPLWHQEQTLHQIAALATSTKPGLASPVAAHAAFEYGLCMLKGFGTSQDIERGLEWVQYGAHIGSPHARAVAHGLHRAYDRGPDLDSDPLWLVKEATCLSDYTQRELEHLLKSTGGHSQQRSMEGVCDSDYESSRSWKEAMNSRNHERAFKAHCRLEIFPRLSLHHPTMLQRQLQLQDPESNGLLAPLLAETAPAEHTPMFFRAILRWLCCTSQLVTGLAEVLVTAAIPFLQQEDLDELFMLALQRGSASWSSFLLDVGARRYTRSDKEFLHPDSRPLAITPLFLLHHISNEEVGHLVLKIVSKGFNVNDRVPVALVDRHPYYPSGSRAYMKKSFSERERFHTTHLKDQIRGSSITPLRWAIAKNRPGLVRALIDAGAEFPLIPDKQAYALENRDPWATDIPLVAVLDQPCYNVEMLRMFLEKHCDQRGEVVFSESPLGLIAMEPDSPMRRLRIVQHLGGGPDRLFPTLDLLRGRQSQSDAELFWAAAMNGHEDIARYLISKGVNIELRWMGMTPLHTSILHGRWGVFQLLLQNGADPWATTTQKGMSALHLLFWKAKPVETELFILGELYAILGDVSAAYSNFGETVSPLHLAVMNSRVRAVRRLIELGADTTAVLGREIMTTMVGEEYTALGIERQVQLAGWERSLGGPQEVQRYVPLRPIEIKGFTAAGLILLREDMFLPEQATRMLKILLAAPTSTDLDEKQFCTRPDIKQNVLHLLAWSRLREKSDVLDWVLEVGKNKGLDLNVRDIHGDTPLHYAYAVLGPRFNTAVNELIKRGADLALRNDIGLTPPEMRNGILLQGFPSPTHPIEITLSRCDQQQKANEPTGLSISRSSELLWSLEKGIFTRTEFWDSKSRKSVKLQKLFKLQEWDSDDETDTKDDGPGFQVQLKTPGSTPATDPKRYETPTDGVIILEIPADLEY